VLALVDPIPSGPAAALRAVLLAATAVVAGVGMVAGGLARPSVGKVWAPGRGVLLVAWGAGLVASAACVAEVLTGGAWRPLAAAQVAVSLLVPLLLGSAGSVLAVRLVLPVSLLVAGLLAIELGTTRTGFSLAVDVVFAVAGAVLLGACVLGVGDGAGSQAGQHGGTRRAARVAVPAGLVTSVAGVAQLALTGPPAGYDMLHTGYGLAALTQAALPVLVSAVWLVIGRPSGEQVAGEQATGEQATGEQATEAGEQATDETQAEIGEKPVDEKPVDEKPTEEQPAEEVGEQPAEVVEPPFGRRPSGRSRAGELSRLCVVGVGVAFATTAALATLPHPAAAPVPGQPLARPVEMPFQHLAVLVAPMRPGPNLVHIAATPAVAGSESAGHHHGAPAPATPPGTFTVSAGGAAVPVTPRAGAPGEWAVLDIPAGTDRITVTDSDAAGTPATVPVDVGTAPAEPALAQALAGPDGPECASAMLGGLVAGSARAANGATPVPTTLVECPSQRLTTADGNALRDEVDFLAGRGITGLSLVADDSPRGRAAADLVRAEAGTKSLPVRGTGVVTDTLLVVSGWSGAVPALKDAVSRSADEPAGGIVLAPWLLANSVVVTAPSEVVALPFNPGESPARQYGATVAAVFPGEGPSTAGYLAWLRAGGPGAPLAQRVTFYGAAPVDVPMGMDDMDMASGNPGDWYPSGTVVPISPPLGPPGAKQ
jgi:hypothetical protein